ncbi:MAG TPA: hypothetical protein VH092_00330 [Urbifossiella sp.]|jgi:hypothetical protein|nr:hypothetical protein [Urbifossiella sp.]
MITGFQAKMSVNDGTASAQAAFAGLITFNLPSVEAAGFDDTELNQMTSGGSPVSDPYIRKQPTGLLEVGTVSAEMKYTKANYLRLLALAGVRDKTYILTTPDDLTTPGTPVVLTSTIDGYVSKVDAVKFEKDKPVSIPFEMSVSKQPTIA